MPNQRPAAGGKKQRPARAADPSGFRVPDVWIWALLFCVTLAVYWPALEGGFLWDDGGHITKPELQSLHGLARIWFDPGATQQYYPFLHTAFWIEHHLWGDDVLGYHVVNIVCHALSACLIVLIVRLLAFPGAWLAGFLFALHPVCVEAVAWISEQKSTLSGFFYLASALAYLHFDRTRRRQHYFLASALFVLALLTKTVTATLPAALLVVIWWQRGRIEWRRDVPPLLPWFGLGIAAGLTTAWMEKTMIGAEGAEFALSPVQRLLLAGRALWFYAGKLIWPADLTFIYPRWNLDPHVWWQYLFPAGVLAVAVGLLLVSRRHRGPLAGLLIFGGTLFPVLGFLNVYPFLFSYVADHFQYLASLGILVPLASVIAVAAQRRPFGKYAPVVLLLVLGGLTWRQSASYHDSETLYRTTLAHNPSSWMAHNNLGSLLLADPGRRQEAVAEYEAALRLKPDYAEAHYSLGNAFYQEPGRLQDAIAQYEAAVRIQPDYAEAHNNLASALLQLPGRLPDAISHYEIAVRLKPADSEARNNLANALVQAPGRLSDAITEYEAALRLNPGDADIHFNLATALVRAGRTSDAIAHYEAALRIKPGLKQARQMIDRLRAGR